MSWIALGRPAHVPSSERSSSGDGGTGLVDPARPRGDLPWRAGLSATSTSAVLTYFEGVERMVRDKTSFRGLSGGRTQISDLIVETLRSNYSQDLEILEEWSGFLGARLEGGGGEQPV